MAVDLLDVLSADPAIAVTGHPGWRTRGTGAALRPEGIVLHHTASSVKSGPHGALPILVNGRTDLRGPLCQITPGRDGTVIVVAAGCANHAGSNSRVALAEMAAGKVSHSTLTARERGLVDNTVGNTRTIGIEIEHSGLRSEPWRLEVISAVVHVCAALCRAYGWGAGHVTTHRNVTARKPDPVGSTDWWAYIASLLTPPPVPTPPPTQGDIVGPIVRLPNGAIVELLDGIPARHIATPAEVQALIAAGLGPQTEATPALAARVRVT